MATETPETTDRADAGSGEGIGAGTDARDSDAAGTAGWRGRGRLGLFGSLCGLVMLMNLGRIVFAPLVEPFRSTFALSAGGAGLVATLAWVGSALPRLPTGWLLTRVPRHRVVAGAGVLLTGAAALTAAAGSPLALYAGALAMGSASGVYFIAANPLVSELFPARVGRAIGIHGTANQVAAVGAPLLVGAVLATASWRAAFWLIAAGTGLATVAVVVAARRADLPSAGGADSNFLRAVREQWAIVAAAIAVVGLAGFVWNGVFNFYVTFLLTRGVGESTARTLLTVAFAAGIPAFLIGGRTADLLPRVPLLLATLVAFAGSLFALTLLDGLVGLAVGSVAVGFAVHSLFPVIDTYLLDSLPDRHRGSAYAVFSATIMLVQAPGSVVLGSLRDAGVGFDLILRGGALGVAAVAVVLFGLYLRGRMPAGAAPVEG